MLAQELERIRKCFCDRMHHTEHWTILQRPRWSWHAWTRQYVQGRTTTVSANMVESGNTSNETGHWTQTVRPTLPPPPAPASLDAPSDVQTTRPFRRLRFTTCYTPAQRSDNMTIFTTPCCNIKARNTNTANARITHVTKQHRARLGGFWDGSTYASSLIPLPRQRSESYHLHKHCCWRCVRIHALITSLHIVHWTAASSVTVA